jgi:uncharacterized protein YndB with AHSA1/START domain
MGTPAVANANDLTLTTHDEMRIDAPLDVVFAAILEEMGPKNVGEGDRPMPMTLEAWPGGRWFRDLGNQNGHLWGHVQAIRRPALLEITGPLFMSFAVVSNVQYRLTPIDGGGTLVTLKHSMMGIIPDDLRAAFAEMPIWPQMLERVRSTAERAARA